MKKFFNQLRPIEQRLLIAVGVILVVIANYVWIWPRFSDWGKSQAKLQDTKEKIVKFREQIKEEGKWKAEKQKLEGEGSVLPSEEMALQLRRFVDEQAALSGLIENGVTLSSSAANRVGSSGSAEKSTGVFEERQLTMGYIAGDAEMVDFLYNLGAGKSTIRVRDLSIKPDAGMAKLLGNMTLIASYQKKSATAATQGTNAPAAKPAVKPPQPTTPRTNNLANPPKTDRVPPRQFKSNM